MFSAEEIQKFLASNDELVKILVAKGIVDHNKLSQISNEHQIAVIQDKTIQELLLAGIIDFAHILRINNEFQVEATKLIKENLMHLRSASIDSRKMVEYITNPDRFAKIQNEYQIKILNDISLVCLLMIHTQNVSYTDYDPFF